ncbi:MAG TPA: hypothetical protein VFV50_04555 [Bdellovibrionales bacterium]|nr:hypothetical protein [Bdellovibrionales bacterium]
MPALMMSFFLIGFQNCSQADFTALSKSSDSIENPPPGESGQDDPNDPGLDGGHFDLDTSSRVYSFSQGRTDKHVHEYDDKYNVSFADFFNLNGDGFTKITDRVGATQAFYVIVANAQLSPGAVLEINGVDYPVVDYQNKILAGGLGPRTFTLGGPNQLTSLKIKFRADALTTNGLIATQTSCVVSNDPGANGEYRNGALIVQILDAATAKLDTATKTAAVDGGLLWEATLFWHKSGAPCY